ncbi:MAG: MtrB/PioB family outer membrane beta-barrel protein [Sideroxydans sp.]|nr:MtrB/PioB family outer membrane beta-barrel protein [Sideroxydans sp.]
MNDKSKQTLRLLPIAAALLLLYTNAYSETSPEVLELTTPSSSIGVGMGAVNSGSNTKRFFQYSGLSSNTFILQDIEINKRDEATGMWTTISAKNIGLETREVNFSQQKQGTWKYAIDYNEIVRFDPYIIHTGMTGVGTATPTINLIATPSMPAAWEASNGLAASNGVQGNDVEMKLKRTAYGLSGDLWITPELQAEVAFKSSVKKGARMFGRVGMASSDMKNNPDATGASVNGNWAVLLMPEPINSNTTTLEGHLNFNRDKLALSLGYYGSYYVNQYGSLQGNVPGTLNRGALWSNCATVGCSTVQQLASAPVALPPDNQSHQYYLSGNYVFANATHSNFKLSYTSSSQNESFAAMGLTPASSAPGSLGGLVSTTLAQVGMTMRPLKELSMNASLRYENRDDQTPVFVYNTSGVANNALNGTTNWASGSQTRTTMKLDGIYRLQGGYSAMLGLDWERKAIPLPPANTALFSKQIFFRPVLTEIGIKSELRKGISETVNGALGVEFKQRRGKSTDWVTTSGTLGNTLVAFDPTAAAVPGNAGGNYVLPDMYMDRDRTKLRGNVDWEASPTLSTQMAVEHAQDNFLRAFPTSITPAQVAPVEAGARKIISDSVSFDSTYIINDDWKLNGFWTRSYSRWNVNKANFGDDTKNAADTLGMSIGGNASSDWVVALDIIATRDKTSFKNIVAAGNFGVAGNIAGWAGQASPGNYLPAIHYRTDKVNLRGKYALDKVSDVLLALSYQHFKTDDWQWGYNGVPFLYSDNTTVSQPASQALKYLSASYLLRF